MNTYSVCVNISVWCTRTVPTTHHPHIGCMRVCAGADGVKVVGELYSVTGSDLQSGAVSVQLYNSPVVSGRRGEGEGRGGGWGEGEGRGGEWDGGRGRGGEGRVAV